MTWLGYYFLFNSIHSYTSEFYASTYPENNLLPTYLLFLKIFWSIELWFDWQIHAINYSLTRVEQQIQEILLWVCMCKCVFNSVLYMSVCVCAFWTNNLTKELFFFIFDIYKIIWLTEIQTIYLYCRHTWFMYLKNFMTVWLGTVKTEPKKNLKNTFRRLMANRH